MIPHQDKLKLFVPYLISVLKICTVTLSASSQELSYCSEIMAVVTVFCNHNLKGSFYLLLK